MGDFFEAEARLTQLLRSDRRANAIYRQQEILELMLQDLARKEFFKSPPADANPDHSAGQGAQRCA